MRIRRKVWSQPHAGPRGALFSGTGRTSKIQIEAGDYCLTAFDKEQYEGDLAAEVRGGHDQQSDENGACRHG